MTTDFGALAPEITSALLYAGPGSSSLTAAASAWNSIAAELSSTARSYDAVVTQLVSDGWQGPSSAALAAAVQPYVAWISGTAAKAEAAAASAQSAVVAFETALASVVPPPAIATNRTNLIKAVSRNIFGLNNGKIAQLESEYSEFWAHNASTLYSYASSSALATKIESFVSAPKITNEAGTASQAAAVASAAASPATSIQTYLQGIITNLQKTLTNLAAPFFGKNATGKSGLTEIWFLLTGQTVLPTNLGAMVNGYSPFAGVFYNTEGLPYFSVGMGNFGTQIAKSAGWLGGAAPAAAAIPKAVPGLGAGVGGAGGQVAAGLGSGAHVAGLTVPQTFPGAQTVSAVKPMSAVPVSEVITAPEAGPAAGNMVGGIPAGMGGAGRGAGVGPRYGFKPTIMARPLPAG
jgi:PPE-repeat protein